jgi:hypothetical protein
LAQHPDQGSAGELSGLRLNLLCESDRTKKLARLGSYYYGSQYDALKYDWDGYHRGYEDADIKPGFKIPMSRRKPSVRIDVPRMIVGRLTAMMLGEEGWPDIGVDGDEDAQDFTEALSRESKLYGKFNELRDRGGSCGTAVASFSFIDGKPRVAVHDAAYITVLEWADKYEFRPARVLEAYPYEKRVFADGKPKMETYYHVRYWDENSETIWEPIPKDAAVAGEWFELPSKTVVHNYGSCPVYWCQNRPTSQGEDGYSDYDNLTDDFDGINRLMSATLKGTVANVDPTLVVKDDPANNPGQLRKGSENAIFAKNGAMYLELTGDSIKTSVELTKRMQQGALDAASVMIADIEYISARAQSAAALRMVYQPMLSQCDILRVQYGAFLVQILTGMLRAAKKIIGTPAGPIEEVDGRPIQRKPTVELSPRVKYEETEDGRRKVVGTMPRAPGILENIRIKWQVYFKPTHQDLQMTIQGIVEGIDKVVSQRTAVKHVANIFNVTDVDQELKDIAGDRQRDIELQGQLHDETDGKDVNEGEMGTNKSRPVSPTKKG